MNRVRHRYALPMSLIASLIAGFGFVACSIKGDVKAVSVPSKATRIESKQSDNAPPLKPTFQEEKLPASESISMNLVDLSSGDRQRKSLLQLKNSIIACVGTQAEGDAGVPDQDNPSILRVTSEMIQNQNNVTQVNGRFGFIVAAGTEEEAKVVGKSVLELEKSFIDVEGSATGVRASSLEDELYLNSLQNVASVVAFNCDVTSDSSPCFCSTSQKAEEMMMRCLTLFDPASVDFKIGLLSFAAACSGDTSEEGLLKRRKAIVSLLSSYAFATSR